MHYNRTLYVIHTMSIAAEGMFNELTLYMGKFRFDEKKNALS